MDERQNAEWMRLIAGCRAGNRRAQQRMFKRFYSPMYRLCMRYAGSTDEADDMLNEGFMKLFLNLDKYEDTGSFEAWVKQVFIHSALDYRRKYGPKVEMTDIEAVGEQIAVGYEVNHAISKLSAEEIVRKIQQLPPMMRTVFNLFVFENFSHAEIAQQLNIAEGTSAWHLNQARARLKEEIYRQN